MSTHETLERFQGFPIASVSSNEPYAIGSDDREAAARRKEAKAAFLAGDMDWPEVDYPSLSLDEMREAERQLLQSLNEIVADVETSDALKDMAYEQIGAKLAEVYRHQEVIRGLGSVAANRELSRERAGAMTLEIFGAPEKDVFLHLLKNEHQKIDKSLSSSDPLRVQTATELHGLIGSERSGDTSDISYELNPHTIEIIRGDLEILFPGLHEFLAQEVDAPVPAKDSIPYFEQALTIVGTAQKGWKAVPSAGAAAGTNNMAREVRIGENRADFTSTTIKGVAFHEALHTLRNQNAREQTEPIKRKALPGNVAAEEGICTAVEQIITGKTRVVGLPYFLSLGFQMGLDTAEGTPRHFRQTHDIMGRRLALEKVGPLSEFVIAKAFDTAYTTVLRTTRGNSLDARDISYFLGSGKANQWFNEVAKLDQEERLEKLAWVFSAMFDPTRPDEAALFDANRETPVK